MEGIIKSYRRNKVVLKKMCRLGIELEIDKLKRVTTITKCLQAGNRLRSLLSYEYQPYLIEKESWLRKQNQGPKRWSQQLWRITHREKD